MPDTTDPTFYRSPAAAIGAPPESLAYVAAFDPTGEQRDAIAVVDCDAGSSGYGGVVGWAELPTAGNELHHFGWNACSSALCHEGHEGTLERRYLIVPGIRSSADLVLTPKSDPRQPGGGANDRARGAGGQVGYSRPHTVHCGPGGIFMSNLGAAGNGDGPGGVALIDHDTFEVTGAWETDRGDQYFAYDVWWHLNEDVAITLGVGDAVDDRGGPEPRGPPRKRFGHHLDFWSLFEGRLIERIDLGDEHQMVLEVRPAHDPRKTWGFVGVVISVEDLSASVWLWHRDDDHWAVEKAITIPAEPADAEQPPFGASALRRRPAAGQRHRPVSRRPLALRLVLGHRGAQAVRRQRSAQPEGDGARCAWAGSSTEHRTRSARATAGRRPTDGGDQPGREAGLLHQLALCVLGRDLLSRRRGRVDDPRRRDADGGGMSVDPKFFPHGDDFRGLRVHQTRLQGWGRVERLVLLRRVAEVEAPSRRESRRHVRDRSLHVDVPGRIFVTGPPRAWTTGSGTVGTACTSGP